MIPNFHCQSWFSHKLRIPLMALAILAVPFSIAKGQTEVADIMPLGDSITRGTNDINSPNGDIPGGYRKNLQARLSSGGFPYNFVGSRTDNAAAGIDPDHNGNNGFRTDQVLANLSTWMAVQPDTVLLLIGTNDILQGVPVATIASNLSTLIDRITTAYPKRRLYVSTVLPISGKDWNGQTAATLNNNANAYNVQVRNLVQQYRNSGRNVTLVDMNALLVYTNTDPSKNVFQPGDGVHPGQAGYGQIGVLWYNAITASGSLVDPPSGPSGYDSWASSYSAFLGLPVADRAPPADPNKDGISNLLSYALGLDPLSNSAVASAPLLIASTQEPGALVFTYRRNKLAPELVYEILVSSNLQASGWSVQGQQQAVTSAVAGEQNIELVSVTIPGDPQSGRKFAYLRVTR